MKFEFEKNISSSFSSYSLHFSENLKFYYLPFCLLFLLSRLSRTTYSCESGLFTVGLIKLQKGTRMRHWELKGEQGRMGGEMESDLSWINLRIYYGWPVESIRIEFIVKFIFRTLHNS